MGAPLSRALPPPPTAEELALRRRRKRLIAGTVLGIFAAVATWQGIVYSTSAPERAEALVEAGIRNLTPGNYEKAILQFSKAIENDPNSWRAYYQRGLARQALNSLDEALADYQTALQIKPDLPEARSSRAGILAGKGEFGPAVEEYTKAIDLKPTMEAHLNRGFAYANLGKHEKAIADFTWVIEDVRDAPNVYFARAKSKRALGDLDGAAADEQAANAFDRDLGQTKSAPSGLPAR